MERAEQGTKANDEIERTWDRRHGVAAAVALLFASILVAFSVKCITLVAEVRAARTQVTNYVLALSQLQVVQRHLTAAITGTEAKPELRELVGGLDATFDEITRLIGDPAEIGGSGLDVTEAVTQIRDLGHRVSARLAAQPNLDATTQQSEVGSMFQHLDQMVTSIRRATGELSFRLGKYVDTLSLIVIAAIGLAALSLILWVLVTVGLLKMDRFRRLATLDPLTGLLNRTEFLRFAHAECSRAIRNGESLGVLLLDLDNFKRVNDQHGHSVGDEVLREAAARLTAQIRNYDRVARYGGDEFLVLLPKCSEGMIQEIADRIRNAFDAPMQVSVGSLRVTICIGSVATDGAGDFESVLETADAAMYRAKELGRNRSVFDDNPARVML